MKAFYQKCLSKHDLIEYQFSEECVIATLNGESEKFDFSTLKEGERINRVQTKLAELVILEAKRKGGEIVLQLLQFEPISATKEISMEATEQPKTEALKKIETKAKKKKAIKE